MKRRHFVGGAVAAAAAALWPSFIRDAFADPAATCDPKGMAKVASSSVVDVATAFRRASRAKRPLLVLVIPADDNDKWNRGHAFGELLNHGSDADLAPLHDVDVVCATMEALRKVIPSVGRGEPMMILVRTTALPATTEAIEVEIGSYDTVLGRTKAARAKPKSAEVVIGERIAALGGALRKALGSSSVKLAERAAEVRARLRDKPLAGAPWARTDGCGSIIEGIREHANVGCGMGFVPDLSKRFLYFFSSDSWL